MTSHTPRRKRGKKKRSAFQRGLRRARHAVTVPAIEALRELIAILPHRGALALARGIGTLGWMLMRGPRRIAETQLLETGLAKDRGQARVFSRAVFQNVSMNLIEWLHSLSWSDAEVAERVEMAALEHVGQWLDAGKGAIAVTAHLGNWELMTRAYVVNTPYRLMAAMTGQSNTGLNEWIIRAREKGGARMTFTQGSGMPMIRHLRAGGMLALLSDQDTKRVRGVFVDFFGRPAFTPSGAALLAVKFGLPIVPLTMERRQEDPQRHRMVFHPPILPASEFEDEAAEVLRLTQLFTNVIEAEIRRRPTDWVWMHRRWKRRPAA